MKTLLLGILVLGSFSSFASNCSKNVHARICKAIVEEWGDFESVKDCETETEVTTDYTGNPQVNYYSCSGHSEVTYSCDKKDNKIYGGDSYIGDSCDQ